MAVYTDVFLASEAEVRATQLTTAHPSSAFPTMYGKNCTNFELAKLEAILEGQDPYAQLKERLETFSLIQEGENCWVFLFPYHLVKLLANLTSSQAEGAATIWAQTEELRSRDGQPADSGSLRDYLLQLGQLAMQAQQEGLHLYLWICV